MDTTENTNCDNEVCMLLGVCIGTAGTADLLDALDDLMSSAYLEGWKDALSEDDDEDYDDGEAVDYIPQDLSVEALANAVDATFKDVGEDFGLVQVWADAVNEYLDNIHDDIDQLSTDADADAVFLEAIAVRLAELEQDNKNLWQALLSK
jgi:hypothetical protein